MGRGTRDSKIKVSENQCAGNSNERDGAAGGRAGGERWPGTCSGKDECESLFERWTDPDVTIGCGHGTVPECVCWGRALKVRQALNPESRPGCPVESPSMMSGLRVEKMSVGQVSSSPKRLTDHIVNTQARRENTKAAPKGKTHLSKYLNNSIKNLCGFLGKGNFACIGLNEFAWQCTTS